MGTKLQELPKAIEDERFLDAAQVSKVLKISRSTLYGLIFRTKNPIPTVKIGKSRRFPVDKLRWWMDNLEN